MDDEPLHNGDKQHINDSAEYSQGTTIENSQLPEYAVINKKRS